jgi:hypothetical protein
MNLAPDWKVLLFAVVLRYRPYLETRQLASGTIKLVWVLYAASPTKPPTAAFSVPTLRPVLAVSKASRGWARALETG